MYSILKSIILKSYVCIYGFVTPKPRSGEIMTTSSTQNTVKLHRILKAPAERIYRAFLEPAAVSKWLPPFGYTCEVQHSDIRIGGTFHMSFTNFASGQSHGFGGKYIELIPYELIRYTDKFDDPSMPNELQVTITLKKVSCGTELSIVQENIPPQIPVEMCYLGWQESLVQLEKLVEPEIS